MKASIISMLIVLVILIVVPLVFFGDNELAENFGFKKSAKSSFNGKPPSGLKNVTTDKRVEVYKWVDEHGVTQFSHSPPQLGGESELVVLKPDTNIVKAIEIPEEVEEKPTASKIFSVGRPITSDGIQDVIGENLDAKDAKDGAEQEITDQQKLIEQMLNQK